MVAAFDALGKDVLAVAACSATYSTAERERAIAIAARFGVSHFLIESNEMNDPLFRSNPHDRCYYCKGELYGRLSAIAASRNQAIIVDGTNQDDLQDIRPGRKAAMEHGVKSPFCELGIGKNLIREMARFRGLPNWDLPACACLASRIPYGEEITRQRLDRIGSAEEAIKTAGFRQVRVRDHGLLARIELAPDELQLAIAPDLRKQLTSACRTAGYNFVCLDLEGYRIGSMNEVLPHDKEDNSSQTRG